MDAFYNFISRMNLLLAIAVVFLLHLLLYVSLGTDRWLFATVMATVTYAIVLAALKMVVQNNNRGVR